MTLPWGKQRYVHPTKTSPVSARKILCSCVIEGVVEQWCNPLTLQPEQAGVQGSIPGRASSLERHDKAAQTRLALSYFCDRSAWR